MSKQSNGKHPRATVDDAEVAAALRVATRVCERGGFPVCDDPEYASAVNAALLKALQVWEPSGARSFRSFACMLALRSCRFAERRLARWRWGDRLYAERFQGQPTPTPIPLEDYEVISFVAAVGRKSAGILLGMAPSKLRDLLDEIAARVKMSGR